MATAKNEGGGAFAIRPGERAWRTMSPGVEVAALQRDADRNHGLMLLRFEAGARAPRHIHPEGEQYLVLEGEIMDETGRYGAGTFVHHPPGSVHEPFSPEGALVLVSWFGRLRVYEDD